MLHFASSFVGECQRQDLPRRNAKCHQPRHAAGDDARLSRAGASKHQKRAINVRNGNALVFGEAFQERVGIKFRNHRFGCMRRC